MPLDQLAELVERLPDTVTDVEPAAQLVLFGHLAEANLHVNVLGASRNAETVTGAVLTLVASLGGSISSEHGIGRAKARWLELSRSPGRDRRHAIDQGRLRSARAAQPGCPAAVGGTLLTDDVVIEHVISVPGCPGRVAPA